MKPQNEKFNGWQVTLSGVGWATMAILFAMVHIQ
jgi:hypothetical protein